MSRTKKIVLGTLFTYQIWVKRKELTTVKIQNAIFYLHIRLEPEQFLSQVSIVCIIISMETIFSRVIGNDCH